ncbi:UNVERIFIED_CONTAM: hypothetical protein GTU68_038524, partial [Idotea baltica]|nr:hypothetical protein [Idotea baltica]
PNTNPVIDNKSSVEFLINSSTQHPVDLFPIANLTKGSKGLELAELYDMQQSGAIAFGDYNRPITNANLLKIALQYCQNFDGLTFSFPDYENISNGGLVNEGTVSTKMGLKGNPALAEELQISRDLFVLEYTGGKLHIPTISTANSVKLVSTAKKKGLNVSCSVATHHLCLTDNELADFNTNFKVNPPLRTQSDKNALIKGVKSGTIDMIVSDHAPIDVEHKKVAFEHALDGTVGLETMFGAANQAVGLDACLEALTTNPRERFGLTAIHIEEGAVANLTLFNPHNEHTFSADDIKSTSKNSAFLNKKLKGKVYGIINNNKSVLSI